jgi:hypothetical protein
MKNLDTANKILIEIAKNNQNITPVTLDDLPLFQNCFAKEPHTYGNSWTYVTQGVYGIGPNNLGYKYYDGTNLSMICVYPKIEQPDLNVFYWIRPMGPGILDVIAEISNKLYQQFSLPTYVKKIFSDQYDSLLKKGFVSIDKFPWHKYSPTEDDTFPEQIHNVRNLYMKIKSMHRSSMKRIFMNSDKLTKRYAIEINDTNFKNTAWQIAQDFFNSEYIKLKKTNLSQAADYYNMIFNNPDRSTFTRQVVYSNKQPVGFFVVEKQNEKYSNFYALILLRHKLKFLADYIWLDIFKNLQTPYLNTGGSEDEGIHKFKLKFLPETEQRMYWATNFKN